MYPPFISPLRPSGSVPTPARSSGSGGGKRRARSSSSGGRGAQAKLAAAQRIEEIAERADKVCEQIARRVTGPKITDPPRFDERLRRAPDPQGQAAPATELGTVMQITEVCENIRRGARGLILPAAPGSDLPTSTTCSNRPAGDSTRSASDPASRHSRAASRPAPSTSTFRHQTERSSPAASRPAPRRPTAGWRSSASAAKPHQPPQTTLWHAPIEAEGPRRRQDLGGVGDPGIQPRHLAIRPDRQPPQAASPARASTTRTAASPARARPFDVQPPEPLVRGK
jgi:hypothetical protein